MHAIHIVIYKVIDVSHGTYIPLRINIKLLSDRFKFRQMVSPNNFVAKAPHHVFYGSSHIMCNIYIPTMIFILCDAKKENTLWCVPFFEGYSSILNLKRGIFQVDQTIILNILSTSSYSNGDE